jgi:predicted component of type VI protein secretion system
MAVLPTDAAPVLPEIERAVADDRALAWLTLPDGQKVPLGTAPVTIGFTADCKVQLPDGSSGPSMERARVWWRDGSYMLHNLSRVGSLRVGGKPVTWAVLEDGDEIVIGDASLVFQFPEESRK